MNSFTENKNWNFQCKEWGSLPKHNNNYHHHYHLILCLIVFFSHLFIRFKAIIIYFFFLRIWEIKINLFHKFIFSYYCHLSLNLQELSLSVLWWWWLCHKIEKKDNTLKSKKQNFFFRADITHAFLNKFSFYFLFFHLFLLSH